MPYASRKCWAYIGMNHVTSIQSAKIKCMACCWGMYAPCIAPRHLYLVHLQGPTMIMYHLK